MRARRRRFPPLAVQIVLAGLMLATARRVWTTKPAANAARARSTDDARISSSAASDRQIHAAFGAPASAAGAAVAMPHSTRHTEVGGDLTVDGQGHFVPTPDARRLFDSLLAATEGGAEATLRARIIVEIRRRLVPPAADEAETLLDAYLKYRSAVRQLAQRDEAPMNLDVRLQRLHELQRSILGNSAAEAFFSEDDIDIERALARRRVAADPDLAPAERARRLTELEAERVATATVSAAREVRAIREAGGTDQEVYALRAQRFGTEAATHLAANDQRRLAWTTRLTAYRAERAHLLEGTFRDLKERRAALDKLRSTYFSPTEMRRVASLDQLAGLE
jgi:lipase chaperone LimK